MVFAQSDGLYEILFNWTSARVDEDDEHYRIAIYVSPSVCQEQRCKAGGGRTVPAERVELDPPSDLDLVKDDKEFIVVGHWQTRRVDTRILKLMKLLVTKSMTNLSQN